MKTSALLLALAPLAALVPACTSSLQPSTDTYLIDTAASGGSAMAPFSFGYLPDSQAPAGAAKLLVDDRYAIFQSSDADYRFIEFGHFSGAIEPGTHTIGLELPDGTRFDAAPAEFLASPQSQTSEKNTSVWFVGHPGAMSAVVRETDDAAVTSSWRVFAINGSPDHLDLSVTPCAACATQTVPFGQGVEVLVPDGETGTAGYGVHPNATILVESDHRDSVYVGLTNLGSERSPL